MAKLIFTKNIKLENRDRIVFRFEKSPNSGDILRSDILSYTYCAILSRNSNKMFIFNLSDNKLAPELITLNGNEIYLEDVLANIDYPSEIKDDYLALNIRYNDKQKLIDMTDISYFTLTANIHDFKHGKFQEDDLKTGDMIFNKDHTKAYINFLEYDEDEDPVAYSISLEEIEGSDNNDSYDDKYVFSMSNEFDIKCDFDFVKTNKQWHATNVG